MSNRLHRRPLESECAICVWIPLFPLRCEERRRPELVRRPAAVLLPEDIRRLWQVSPGGRRAGVRPGMTVSQAIGLCPPLALVEPDPVHYDEQFTRLLIALEDVSPVIEPAELGRVYVGADGLERLYGGPVRQLRAVSAAVRQSGGQAVEGTEGREGGMAVGGQAAEQSDRAHTYRPTVLPPHRLSAPPPFRLGWGRGTFVAWVAASRAKPNAPLIVKQGEEQRFIATQPVAVLPVSADTHHRLRQLGITTLGELAQLPEAALVSQFGREGRRAWQLAAGGVAAPVVGRERPEPITAAMDFPAPAADRAMLALAIRRLVDRALRHPRRSGWRVHVARARAALEQGASWITEVTLKDPSADRDRIAAPLTVRLEQSPPQGAVERLVVEFVAFARGTDELQLFARDAEAAARAGRRRALHTAAREIKTRLKRAMLYHVVEVQPWSRIPERRYALIDFEY